MLNRELVLEIIDISIYVADIAYLHLILPTLFLLLPPDIAILLRSAITTIRTIMNRPPMVHVTSISVILNRHLLPSYRFIYVLCLFDLFGTSIRSFIRILGNLPTDLTEQELKELFAPYGTIESIVIHGHHNYAFVNFEKVHNIYMCIFVFSTIDRLIDEGISHPMYMIIIYENTRR